MIFLYLQVDVNYQYYDDNDGDDCFNFDRLISFFKPGQDDLFLQSTLN